MHTFLCGESCLYFSVHVVKQHPWLRVVVLWHSDSRIILPSLEAVTVETVLAERQPVKFLVVKSVSD